jgi:hypothetical protein
MSKKILRTITIDELDQGYKVTTDTRGGCGPCPSEGEQQYRQELAVANLAKTLKIAKDYFLPDIEAADTGDAIEEEQVLTPVTITSATKMNASGSKEDIKVKKRGA